MKKHIDTLIDFVSSQMDNAVVPPHNSPALARLSEAVAAVNKNPSDPVLRELALGVLGVVIDRVRSNIAAEQTLRAFLTGGGHV